jgi:putative transposase
MGVKRYELNEAELIKDRDNKYLMLDCTLVRVHQRAAGGKGGPRIRRWGVPEGF